MQFGAEGDRIRAQSKRDAKDQFMRAQEEGLRRGGGGQFSPKKWHYEMPATFRPLYK